MASQYCLLSLVWIINFYINFCTCLLFFGFVFTGHQNNNNIIINIYVMPEHGQLPVYVKK